VRTPSVAHNIFPNVAGVDKWGGNLTGRFMHPHSRFLAHNFLAFSSPTLSLRCFPTPATDRSDGAQPPAITSSIGG
jgi:hypothetical protein